MNEYSCLKITYPAPGVAAVQLYRPEALNALNMTLMSELVDACSHFDANDDVRCIVLHGSKKAFAAGADIKEMEEAGTVTMIQRDQFASWERVRATKKPIIAAVSGFALGGGCELAMLCDMIVASDTAQFGQPEINLGVIPGAGGTQRLTRAVGKALAMEMILSGRTISAVQAHAAGLVNRVVPVEYYLEEAISLAKDIASKSTLAVQLAKEAVNQAYITNLDGGIQYERKNFYMLFSSEDQKEGMRAFVEKRKPTWKGK